MRRLGCIAWLVVVTACDAGPYCDHDAAESALAAAAPGDVVELGACEVMGPLHVPPGVTLAGGPSTVLVAPAESAAVVALGDDAGGETVVRDLDVRVEGRIGILFRGGGAARVSDVELDVRRGIGLGAAELGDLTMSGVTLRGEITQDNADDSRWVRVIAAPVASAACPSAPCDCEPGEVDAVGGRACDANGRWATLTATYGLVLSGVTSATLTDVTVAGFAQWGAVLVDSGVTWSGGAVADTLGIGVRQAGGTLALTDVSVEGTRAGLRGERPYGVITAEGGRLEGHRVIVADNDRYGVLISGGTGILEDLVAERNGDAALWVASTTDFELCGTATRIADNDFAGAVVTDSTGVRLADGAIRASREVERPVGIGVLRVGDGVHLTGLSGPIELVDLTIEENARSGIVLDLGATGVSHATFTNVAVTGSGTQLGAVAGRPASGGLAIEPPGSWDSGITRNPALSANDAAFTGTIAAVEDALPSAISPPGDVLGVVAPMF
ncbi:MAG: right-handed parallel beta-helix repeat-containing protein [Sandaracinaceae bacterium]